MPYDEAKLMRRIHSEDMQCRPCIEDGRMEYAALRLEASDGGYKSALYVKLAASTMLARRMGGVRVHDFSDTIRRRRHSISSCFHYYYSIIRCMHAPLMSSDALSADFVLVLKFVLNE